MGNASSKIASSSTCISEMQGDKNRGAAAYRRPSVYGSLFNYRPSPNRRPLEDFLSEALVDLLGRLSVREQSHFVADVLLNGVAGSDKWRECFALDPDARFRWDTQTTIRNAGVTEGRLDILLTINGQPRLVLENKVGAIIRPHLDVQPETKQGPTPTVTLISGNQIQTYGRWLQRQAPSSNWPTCLILLTHFSKAPSDFSPENYSVSQVNVCQWRSVWKWAKELSLYQCRTTVETSVLVKEFRNFLEEQSMSSEYASFQDIAKAQIYTESAGRMENLFSLLDAAAEKTRKPLEPSVTRTSSMGFHSEYSVIWSWFYFKKPKNVAFNWHIAWGIRFPTDQVDCWNGCIPPLPGVPHAFVTTMTEGKLPIIAVDEVSKKELHSGWSRDAGEGVLVVSKPLHEFGPDPEKMAQDMAEWVEKEVTLIAPVLTKLASKFE